MDEHQVEIEGRIWRLGAEIGSGGFGRVRDAESDGERAAVKFVPKVAGAERELLMVDLPSVPNVVPVLATGETEAMWVLVMPLAERSLRAHLEQTERLELMEALAVLRDIADALAGLAAAGVVHRDLKPENVLLLKGRWCLADFGISRYAEATTAPDTRKYSMTAAYAAPEQWRLMRATPAADVYAFAVMAYELLTGQRPFLGPDGDDYREQHLHASAPTLDGVGAPLAALIGECLYKQAEARPSAANVVARLATITNAPATAGLARLQQVNREEVTRLGEQARQRAQEETDAERRLGLAVAARRALDLIVDEVRQTIEASATAASRGARSSGWSVRFGDGELRFTELKTASGKLHACGKPIGIEVIAFAAVSVTMQEANHYEYQGRSHSLWFCNAQEAEHYQWFELAFMQGALMGSANPQVHPFAMGPDSDAAEALSRTMGTVRQLAWPFIPVVAGQLDEFIGRWADWLAAAAQRQLQHPSMLPERPIDGSYRRD